MLFVPTAQIMAANAQQRHYAGVRYDSRRSHGSRREDSPAPLVAGKPRPARPVPRTPIGCCSPRMRIDSS